MHPSVIQEMTIEDLPGDDLRWIAQECGLDVAKKVWQRCRGVNFSVPSRVPKAFAVRYISRHYNGSNTGELARRLGITERCVYSYLNARLPASSPQMSLF